MQRIRIDFVGDYCLPSIEDMLYFAFQLDVLSHHLPQLTNLDLFAEIGVDFTINILQYLSKLETLSVNWVTIFHDRE